MNNETYKSQVALLVRIMPLVYRIEQFAVHGGTAINLFHKNMPRYSVDIDLTYIPIESREESLKHINEHLKTLKVDIERAIPGIRVTHKSDVLKLQCSFNGAMVKIEVNGTKRGVLGEVEIVELCTKAQEEFQAYCKARIVPYSQLYGGKITAALSRQHPRDLFDCKYMEMQSIEQIKDGFFLCLLGSDKPFVESLAPNPIDQEDALDNQFNGMTDIEFTYTDYQKARTEIIDMVNNCLTEIDKEFLLSFEQGSPNWSLCCAGNLSAYPSVQWKLLNIRKLKQLNPKKFQEGIDKLRKHFEPSKKHLSKLE